MAGALDLVQLKVMSPDELEKLVVQFAGEIEVIKEKQRVVQFELGQRSRLEKLNEMMKVLSDSEKYQLQQVLASQGISSNEKVQGSQIKG